jgi:SAM-dependent methyltransferase
VSNHEPTGTPGWRDADIGVAPDIETSSQGYAQRFAGPAGEYMLAVQARLVADVLEPFRGAAVLEVGAGHGQLLEVYDQLSMSATLHGSAPSCFSRLAAQGCDQPVVVSDIVRLPFADRSFDVVVAIRLVSHLVDWQGAIAEMCRVARQAVVIDYPSRHSLNAIAPMLFALKKKVEGNTREFALFRGREMRQVFQRCGLGGITEAKQFFLPMALHRMLGAHAIVRRAEDVCRAVGLTRAFGSPVILRARRADVPPKPAQIPTHTEVVR